MITAQLNAEVLRNMSIVVEDESLMAQLAKYLRKLVAKKEDATLMSKEEFFANIDEAKKEIEENKCHTFDSAEELDKYIRSL